MIKVLFVCHGNICRSPMAEYLFKKMVKELGIANDFYIASKATSNEEIGNPIYPNTKRILSKHNINCEDKTAEKLVPSDYNKFDYIIGMDKNNVININRILGYSDKTCKLLDYTGIDKDISDPWYTRDFNTCEEDITSGLKAFLVYLMKNNKVKL